MIKRETLRQVLILNILDEFVRQGFSKERAEFEVQKMNDSGDLGMRTDLLFNKIGRCFPSQEREMRN